MQLTEISVDKYKMETTRHGSDEFPLETYHTIMSRNILGYTKWHWHEELQFCLVTDGTVIFHVNERQYRLAKGDGIFINSGYLHMAMPIDNPDSAYICLDTDSKLLSGFSGSIMDKRYVQPFLPDPSLANVVLLQRHAWAKSILCDITKIYELTQAKDFGYELNVCSLLCRMWISLLQNRPELQELRGSRHSNSAVQGILACIEEHYGERLTIDMIAREVSFSPSECCRIFKKITGETIFSHLRNYRLAQGMNLLRHTNLPVSQIAYDTGFCSTSYFIEVFKANVGVTPLQYRFEHKEGT